jgi:hypothetical protein
MPIALTHIAEEVFARMVNKHRDAFLSFCGLADQADAAFVKAAPKLAVCKRGSKNLEDARSTGPVVSTSW